MRAPLVVVGDALLDRDVEGVVERLAPDAPVAVLDERCVRCRPGGAGLAAALAAAEGRQVTLVSALGDDAAGQELKELLAAARVELIDLGLDGRTPEKLRLQADGRTMLRVDRGEPQPARVGPASAAARAAIGWAPGVLVADYGRGVSAELSVRQALADRVAGGAALVWDPHPRGTPPIAGASLVTPNAREAALFAPEVGGDGLPPAAARAARLRSRWGALAVCVTMGRAGALLDRDGALPLALPAPELASGDPCGAGDRFAASAAALLADGATVEQAVSEAVSRASRFVAGGGAAAFARSEAGDPGAAGPPQADLDRAIEAIAAVRARGGCVVATGGCFDLLHAGHLRTLRAARALGDCLIVCLNGDDSARRLKGPSRPLVPEADRAALLCALECVDAVVVFEQDTPTALLERLRPDVWAKGGDYAGVALPEERALQRFGARAVVLPHLPGHSTTRLIQEAATRVAI